MPQTGLTLHPAEARYSLRPDAYDAALFDLDGVVTRTALLHAAAWSELFNRFLQAESRRTHRPQAPFDPEDDYLRYVDGKPRYEGVQSFLAARGIDLPWGNPEDAPGYSSVIALGKLKDGYFLERLRTRGVEVYLSTLRVIEDLLAAGCRTALVTSSKNGQEVLEQAGLSELFEARVDGNDLERLSLRGKPSPDSFLAAARLLNASPGRTIVFEDAISGVVAGKAGGFGLIIGINRGNQARQLLEAGADIVVDDLSALRIEPKGGDTV
jgi:alpha,alpha-trehalase